MQFTPTSIPDVVIVEPQLFGDHRGFFMETYHADKYRAAGIDVNFVQQNHSSSTKGVLRGLHYQIKNPQGKLVRIVKGEVFDVAVDMRKSSATYGKWVGEILTADNHKQLWVPPGFAHGFYVLSDEAEFLYSCTDMYAPEHERSLIWNDPTVGINWPLIEGVPLKLSEKDETGKVFADAETYP